MFCAAEWVSIKFSTFNQGCATTFMRSPLAVIVADDTATIKQTTKTINNGNIKYDTRK